MIQQPHQRTPLYRHSKDNPGLTFLGDPGTDSKTRLSSLKDCNDDCDDPDDLNRISALVNEFNGFSISFFGAFKANDKL